MLCRVMGRPDSVFEGEDPTDVGAEGLDVTFRPLVPLTTWMPTTRAQTLQSSQDATDESLVEDVLRGNIDAFSLLMRRHNQKLYRIVRGITGDDASAEDAIQQAYLSAFRSLGQLRGQARFGAWLKRIAVREAFRIRRDSARRGELSRQAEAAKVVPFPSPPEQRLAARQWARLVEAAIDELPDGYREVLVMRKVEHLSTEQTAELLGVSQENVRVRLYRARKLLANRLYDRAGDALDEVYEFGGERCGRIVALVCAQLGL